MDIEACARKVLRASLGVAAGSHLLSFSSMAAATTTCTTIRKKPRT
jgi:hypothetical protein